MNEPEERSLADLAADAEQTLLETATKEQVRAARLFFRRCAELVEQGINLPCEAREPFARLVRMLAEGCVPPKLVQKRRRGRPTDQERHARESTTRASRHAALVRLLELDGNSHTGAITRVATACRSDSDRQLWRDVETYYTDFRLANENDRTFLRNLAHGFGKGKRDFERLFPSG